MTSAKYRERCERGFTLVELMVSLVIFSLVVAGILSVAVSMTQGFREQRGAVAVEQAVRVPLDFIADALRQASPGVSDLTKMQDATTCDALGAIVVTNSSTGPDALELVYASGGIVTSTRGVVDNSSSTVTVTDAGQLRANDYVVITDTGTGHVFKVTNVTGSVLTVVGAGTGCAAFSYGQGALVIRAQRAKFTIQDVDGVPNLMMDPDASGSEPAEPLAEGIEDLQVAVGVDATTDGITEVGGAANDDEWHYNFPLDAAPSSTGVVRAVRVTLIARALAEVKGGITHTRPASEDRAAGSADNYRRRVLRSIVEVRNAGGSP